MPFDGAIPLRSRYANRAPKPPFVLNKDSPQAIGLVVSWPMFGNSPLQDYSRNKNRLQLQSSYPITGFKVNKFRAKHFVGGTSGYLDAADLPVLDDLFQAQTARSCVFWARFTTGANTVVSEKGTNAHLVIQTLNGRMIFRIAGNSSNIVSTLEINDDVWRQLAFTATAGATTNSKAWTNAVLGETKTGQPAAGAANNDPFVIGARAGNNFAYPGDLFDFRLYNYALTPAVVRDCYNPPTRWDLYYELGQRSFYPYTASAAAAEFFTNLVMQDVTRAVTQPVVRPLQS